MKKLVVGIPCHNESDFICDCLSSIRSNNLDDVNVEIYDNASTDDTVHKVEKFIERLPPQERSSFAFKTRAQKVSPVESFMSTFQESESEYFLWVGAHDLLSKNYLDKCLRVIESNADVSMVSGKALGFRGDFENIIDSGIVYDFADPNPMVRYLKSLKELNNCTVFHSIFRRQDLKELTISYNCPSADHIIISNLLWHGQLQYVNDVGYLRRHFDKPDRHKKLHDGHYVHKSNNTTFYNEYLGNFRNLSSKKFPEIIQTQLEKTIFDVLVSRFGIPY